MLKVAFNAVPLLSPITGIGQYTLQLLEGLDAQNDMRVEKFYASKWSHETRQKPLAQTAQLWKKWIKKWVPNSYQYARAAQQKVFNKGVAKFKPDIYHEPNYLAFEFDGPTVITVHDLSWIRYPQHHPLERVMAMNQYFEPALRRAQHIITDSAFVKQEVIDVFGLSPDIIHPVYLGVEDQFKPHTPQETQDTLAKHGLQHQQYLLAVGTLEPRKNMGMVLQAFMALPKAVRRQHPLVIVGMTGWHASPLEQRMSPLLAAGEIIQLGYLTRQELIHVTASACAMVYPSLYEGFGLPPLEAMACGVPVIASDVSSLPEVVGDTGLLVDPHNPDAITQAMHTLTQAPELRTACSQQALLRSRQFSWQKCQQETIGVYRAALA
jgi:alpha-1,3-rhamnosyl/mannosyltransferase